MTAAGNEHLLSAERLAAGLATRRVGRRIVLLAEVDSTNRYAMEMLAPGDGQAADGTVVLAEHQTAGRGRLGRRWIAPRGAAIQLTVVLTYPQSGFSHGRLMMSSALAGVEGISEATDVEPTIRWPNDLYVGNRKLAGILIETKQLRAGTVAVALGMGINCLQQRGHFSPELAERATSLEIESRQAIDRHAVVCSVLRALDRYIMANVSDETLATRWREHSTDIGALVDLSDASGAYRGRILDVHPMNGLLLQLEHGGRRHFDAASTSRL